MTVPDDRADRDSLSERRSLLRAAAVCLSVTQLWPGTAAATQRDTLEARAGAVGRPRAAARSG